VLAAMAEHKESFAQFSLRQSRPTPSFPQRTIAG
jgi:hypothetical protein